MKDYILDDRTNFHLNSFREDFIKLKFLYNYFCLNESEISNKIAFLLPQDVPEEVVLKEIQSQPYYCSPSKNRYNYPPYLALKQYSVDYAPAGNLNYLSPTFSCELKHLKSYENF